jgi:hypothetical protein
MEQSDQDMLLPSEGRQYPIRVNFRQVIAEQDQPNGRQNETSNTQKNLQIIIKE